VRWRGTAALVVAGLLVLGTACREERVPVARGGSAAATAPHRVALPSATSSPSTTATPPATSAAAATPPLVRGGDDFDAIARSIAAGDATHRTNTVTAVQVVRVDAFSAFLLVTMDRRARFLWLLQHERVNDSTSPWTLRQETAVKDA